MKHDVKLHTDYLIQVKSSSVLGGKYVDVYEGSQGAELLDPALRITGKQPVDFIEEASDAIVSIRSSLEQGGVLGNLEETMKNLKEITGGLERGEGTIGKLLKEDAVYADIKQITADLKDVSGRLSRGEGTLGKLLSSDESVYNDLKDTLNTVNESMAKVGRGEGTLGKLINDEALYDELMKTLAEIRAMFDDIRETSPVTSLSSIFFGAF
jgi:phospholipid/cholesterol/gamma-HCH transport system substrate-binding protein